MKKQPAGHVPPAVSMTSLAFRRNGSASTLQPIRHREASGFPLRSELSWKAWIELAKRPIQGRFRRFLQWFQSVCEIGLSLSYLSIANPVGIAGFDSENSTH